MTWEWLVRFGKVAWSRGAQPAEAISIVYVKIVSLIRVAFYPNRFYDDSS